MDFTTFLLYIYCTVDDWLQGQRLRQRGPRPTLSDSEVLTMEIAGAFLSLETDQALFQHFRRYHADCFPALRRIDRTTFVRQSAKLCPVKWRLWQHLLEDVAFDSAISLVDSFPVPVCRFARAPRCQRFRGEAAFAYDELAHQTFYGLRAHLRVCWPGVIVGLSLAPANLHDLEVAATDLLPEVQGWVLADRNYWSPRLTDQLRQQGAYLLAPFKSSRRERQPWPRWLVQKRRRIETLIGQLVERYHAKRVWARDDLHLWSRWLRRVLSHTFAVLLCQRLGLSPLRFAELVTH